MPGPDEPVPAGAWPAEAQAALPVALQAGVTGAVGQLHTVALPGVALPGVALPGPLLVHVLGRGPQPPTPTELRQAGARVARAAAGSQALAVDCGGLDVPGLRALAEGLLLASYRFSLRAQAEPRRLTQVDLVRPDAADAEALQPALAAAELTAATVHTARDLVNTPALVASPAWLADRAAELAAAAGIGAEALDEEALAAGGYGGILAVGAGSARPPRLVRLTYAPAGAGGETPHVVLVGKGVTFDSGGLSLKPADAMVGMKTDMSGAAAVLAVAAALPALRARVRVTALAPLAENMPSGTAVRPGDVVTHWPGPARGGRTSGRTSEVLNTDAEGRLVLADCLTAAAADLAPTAVVDVATLTGAMTLALGRRTAGIFATDDALAEALLAAAEAAGERLWRMPLVEEYRDGLESAIADLANIGRTDPGYPAGAVLAALYLREFTGGVPCPPRHRRARALGRRCRRGDPGRHGVRRGDAAPLARGAVGTRPVRRRRRGRGRVPRPASRAHPRRPASRPAAPSTGRRRVRSRGPRRSTR